MPTVPPVAEPDVAVVRPAYDVVPVGGSIFVHAHVSIDVCATMMGMTITASTAMASAVVTSAVVTSAVVTSAVAATVAFRIRRGHDSNSERGSDRKDERNFLQHFFVLTRRSFIRFIVLSQKARERALNEKRNGIARRLILAC